MWEGRWLDRRIRELEAEVAAEEAGEVEPDPAADRRFVLGALLQRRGRPLAAAGWFLAAARRAEGQGDGATARALVRLAREIAPGSLEAARESRRLASSGWTVDGRGLDGH